MTFQSIDDLREAMAHVAKMDQRAFDLTWGECIEGQKLRKDAELLESLQDGAKTANAIGEIMGDHASNIRIRVNRLMKEGRVKAQSVKVGRYYMTFYSLTKTTT